MNRRTPKTLFSVPLLVQDITTLEPPTLNVEKQQLLDIMTRYTNKQIRKEDTLQRLAELEQKLSTPS